MSDQQPLTPAYEEAAYQDPAPVATSRVVAPNQMPAEPDPVAQVDESFQQFEAALEEEIAATVTTTEPQVEEALAVEPVTATNSVITPLSSAVTETQLPPITSQIMKEFPDSVAALIYIGMGCLVHYALLGEISLGKLIDIGALLSLGVIFGWGFLLFLVLAIVAVIKQIGYRSKLKAQRTGSTISNSLATRKQARQAKKAAKTVAKQQAKAEALRKKQAALEKELAQTVPSV